jgi:hypothetical protein
MNYGPLGNSGILNGVPTTASLTDSFKEPGTVLVSPAKLSELIKVNLRGKYFRQVAKKRKALSNFHVERRFKPNQYLKRKSRFHDYAKI